MGGNDEENLTSTELRSGQRRVAVRVQSRATRVVLHSGVPLSPNEDRLVVGYPRTCLVPLPEEHLGIGTQVVVRLALDYDASAATEGQAEALLEAVADHLTLSANLPA
jgi:hypothetical protein